MRRGLDSCRECARLLNNVRQILQDQSSGKVVIQLLEEDKVVAFAASNINQQDCVFVCARTLSENLPDREVPRIKPPGTILGVHAHEVVEVLILIGVGAKVLEEGEFGG